MTPTGVNGQAAMVLTHAGDATSVLHSTLLTRTPTTATIAGTAATLTLPGPFFMPGDVVVTSADGSRTVTWTDPEPIGHGALYHSALEAARCIGEGLLESPLHDAASVQTNMAALDEVTRQLGITYAPADPEPESDRAFRPDGLLFRSAWGAASAQAGGSGEGREDVQTEEGAQRLGHADRAVGLLVVLEDRDEPARRAERAVERRDGAGARAVRVALAGVEPARLERRAVRRRASARGTCPASAPRPRSRTCGPPDHRGRRPRCR